MLREHLSKAGFLRTIERMDWQTSITFVILAIAGGIVLKRLVAFARFRQDWQLWSMFRVR